MSTPKTGTFKERLGAALVEYLLKNPESSGDSRRIRGFEAGARAALLLAAEDMDAWRKASQPVSAESSAYRGVRDHLRASAKELE